MTAFFSSKTSKRQMIFGWWPTACMISISRVMSFMSSTFALSITLIATVSGMGSPSFSAVRGFESVALKTSAKLPSPSLSFFVS